MANSNFVVQNGLTVGTTTIFAGNGDITTTGNITVSGGGSFGGLSTNQVYQGASNVTVSGSFVNVSIGSTNVASFSSTGLTVLGTTTTVQNETVQGSLTPSSNVAYNLGSPSLYWSNGWIGQVTANTVTATTIGGTLSTAAQTNITSVGTLTGLTVSGAIVPNGNLTVNLGSTSAWWNNIYGTAIHSLYADLAENYQADKTYMPGTVVMFGGDAEVTIATADTTAVAGVISTNPAHLMNGGLSGPNVTPVALMGRVPCMVIGPVAKGDLLVSAGFGYAKVNNTPPAGTIIGKALQDVPFNGKAVIEVVVGRT